MSVQKTDITGQNITPKSGRIWANTENYSQGVLSWIKSLGSQKLEGTLQGSREKRVEAVYGLCAGEKLVGTRLQLGVIVG